MLNFDSRPLGWFNSHRDKDILIIKPLGGTDAEVIGLYKPLYKDQLNSNGSAHMIFASPHLMMWERIVILRQHVFFIMRADYHS